MKCQRPNSHSTSATRPRFLLSSKSHWSFLHLCFLLISGILRSSAASFFNHNIALDKKAPLQPATCLFARKRGKFRKSGATTTAANNKRAKKSFGGPLTEEELTSHVASKYLASKHMTHVESNMEGGFLYEKTSSSKFTKTSSTGRSNDEYSKFIGTLHRHPALVLNADYQPISYLPLSMWTWQESVKALFSGKVTVVETYPDVVIRTASLEIPLPSVIALNEYIRPVDARPAFTKRNVYLRDEYKCQYCNDRFHTKDLSLDHVVPRCRGGRLDWENAVTCCRRCNGKKGNLSVQQLRSVGMRLLREPIVPTQFQLHAIAGRMLPRKVHPSWAPFLGLDKKKDDRNSSVGGCYKEVLSQRV